MKNGLLLLMAIMASTAVAQVTSEHPFATWRSSVGTTVRARFVGLDGPTLTLENESGKQIKLPTSQLDQTSRDLARAFARIVELEQERITSEPPASEPPASEPPEMDAESTDGADKKASSVIYKGEYASPADAPEPEAPTDAKWGWVEVVDKFGESTGQGQMCILREGTFRNTATTGSECSFVFGFQENGGKGPISENGGLVFFVKVLEYGSSPMTHFDTGQGEIPYMLHLKVPDLEKAVEWPLNFSGGYLVIPANDATSNELVGHMLSLLLHEAKQGSTVKCVIENTSDPQNDYRFDLPLDGFQGALDYLLVRRKK